MEDKELFEDYEIKNWELSPRVYKILGASALAHLLFFTVFAQFNLLSAKACDSPYVSKVCQVLDATYLATIFLGEDTSFVTRDYEKTEIEDAEITFIDVSAQEPPLQYPEGYFAVANPETAMSQDMLMPMDNGGFPTTPSSPSQLDFNTPQVLPTPNNDVAKQPLPDSPFSFGNDSAPKPTRVPTSKPPRNKTQVAKQTKPKNESPDKLPKLEGEDVANNANANTNQTVANNKPENANKPGEVSEEDKDKFNDKPLKDFGTKYGEKILSKEVNINAPFTIEVIAGLDEHGKLVKPVMKAAPGSDPKMTEVAKEAIAAFSDSQLLKPLYDVGGRNVKITFAQNQDNLQAIIQTETKSELQAKTLHSGLNLYINNFFKPKEGSDEQVLMKKAQFATQGKVFIINFLIPNDEKTQMIEKSLKNLKQEKEKQAQPNGLAANKDKSSKV